MMAENSKIEWTTHTFNPWVGCQKISPACEHCYAEGWAKRTGQAGLWRGERRRTSAANWRSPLKWNKEAEATGTRPRVFCSSLADVFEDHPAIDTQWRCDLWELIDKTPYLDWLLLTKRPENIGHFAPKGGFTCNVWLGTTVENQEFANKRIPALLKIPVKVRFLSIEPMLGPIDLYNVGAERWDVLHGWKPANEQFPEGANTSHINWIICGGESGPNARPSHPNWFRSLREQCQKANVPFFFKQWGEFSPDNSHLRPGQDWPDSSMVVQVSGAPLVVNGFCYSQAVMHRIGKKNAGRLLDGRTWDEFPEVR